MMRLKRAITEAFVDNPVLEKDALMQMRAPKYLGAVSAFAAFAMLAVFGTYASIEASDRQLAMWGTFHASGRAIFALLVGGALVAMSLVVPAIGSSAIAAERERGTLPLLTATALSPTRIVAGKIAALLVAVAPFLVPLLALLPLAHVYGDVSLPLIALSLAFIGWHTVCCAALSVAASAASKKLRGAAPLAIVCVAIASLPAALPAAIGCAMHLEHDKPELVVPFVLAGAFLETVLAIGAALWARSELSFRADARWPLRRFVVVALVFVFPIVAAFCAALYPAGMRDAVPMIALLHFEVVCVVVVTLLAEVLLADKHKGDGRTPLGQAWLLGALGSLALAIVWLMPSPRGLRSHDDFVWQLEIPSVLAMGAYLLFAGTLAAAIARVIKSVPARIVLLLGILFVNMVVPVFLVEEVARIIPLGPLTFGWSNVAMVIDSIERSGDMRVNPILALVFAVGAPIALSLIARKRATP